MNLSQHEIADIIERLQNGENLPDDYKYKLFPVTQKEYELVYGGKMRREDILANEDGVFPVPLQIEKIYNSTREQWQDGWRNIIAFGDNLQFLKTIYEDKDPLIKDKVSGKVKLIYIDPPFATEGDFKSNQGQKAYIDKAKGAEFIEFLRRRLILARETLAEDGSIFVHLDHRKLHYIKAILDEVFGENNFRNEITWKRTSAHNDSGKFGINTDYILYYTKSENYIWNQQFGEYTEKHLRRFRKKDEDGRLWTDGPLTAKGLSGGGYNYSYKGINGYWRCPLSTMEELDKQNHLHFTNKGGIRIKRYLDGLAGTPLQTIWTDIDPINSQASERVGYPTQKPEKLLERIIICTTNPGDLVMDFFAGAGTLSSVAEKLNRKWISCDIGKLSFYITQKRLLNIQFSKSLQDRKKKYEKLAKSFISVNTGQYDLEKVFKLQQEEYSKFVMTLFEVEPKEKNVNGIRIDGERKDGYNVIIWEYWKFKDATVDEDYLNDLHGYIGNKAGKRVYIIAPASYVGFISDYYEIDKVRYYFLKVPYQVIRELHKVQFKKFRQPQSKNNVNNLDDAIGFHFMRQPEVKSDIMVNENEVKITIHKFLSDFTEDETGQDMQNFESLSMVLLDKDFNGSEFDLDAHYFAEDLLPNKKKKLEDEPEMDVKEELKQVSKIKLPVIPVNECGNRVMIIYIDIYGNEFKEEFKVK
jgi:adenine-specific DNA-methyltransferase